MNICQEKANLICDVEAYVYLNLILTFCPTGASDKSPCSGSISHTS